MSARAKESAKAEKLLRRVLAADPPVLSKPIMEALQLAVSLLEARKFDGDEG